MARLTIIFALLASFAWIGPALAGKRVALVVGNGAYEHASKLPNPTRDASDVATALKSIGFSVSSHSNLDKSSFEEALADFSDTAAGAEFAIVFYAGHGIEVDKHNYLIPVDAKLETDRRVRFETISLEDVSQALEGVNGIRMVLLDACRNNPFAETMTRTVASRSIGRGLSRVEAANGTVIGFAAKEGSVASDGEGSNSPFTTALLSQLTEPGLELQFMLRRIRDRVMAETDGKQEPYISASLPGEAVYLVPPSKDQVNSPAGVPVAAPATAPDAPSASSNAQEDWEAVKETDSLEVLEAFARQYSDNLIYRALAQERIADIKARKSMEETATSGTEKKESAGVSTKKPSSDAAQKKPQSKSTAKKSSSSKQALKSPSEPVQKKPVVKDSKAKKKTRPNATDYVRAGKAGRGSSGVYKSEFGTIVCARKEPCRYVN